MKATIKRNGYDEISSTELTNTIRIPVRAGMETILGTGKILSYKIKTVGYDYYLHTFDSPEKDCMIKSERIKRVMIPR